MHEIRITKRRPTVISLVAQHAGKDLEDLVRRIDALGGEVTDGARAALAKTLDLAARRPRQTDTAHVASAFAASRPGAADAKAVEASTNQIRYEAWEQALYRLRGRAEGELFAGLPRTVESFRVRAEHAISELIWWAESGSPEPSDLLRKRETKAAQRASDVQAELETFAEMRQIRDQISGFRKAPKPPAFANWDHVATLPDAPNRWDQIDQMTLGECAELVRAGAEPWWPRFDQFGQAAAEAEDAADRVVEARLIEAEETKYDHRMHFGR